MRGLAQDSDSLSTLHVGLVGRLREKARVMIESQSAEFQEFDRSLREQYDALVEELKESSPSGVSSNGASDDDERTPMFAADLGEQAQDLEAWEKRLQKFEEQLEERSHQFDAVESSLDANHVDRIARELEAASEEVESLRKQNVDLQAQLDGFGTASEGGSMALSPGDDDTVDWETQKQQMLGELETGGHEGGEASIKEAILKTDQIVAQRDSEISKLKELLRQQSGNIGSVAVGAASIADMLDQDDLVCQERESLQKLQEEWRGKLKETEVSSALERAKLARESADLEAKLRLIESTLAKRGIDLAQVQAELAGDVSFRAQWREQYGQDDTESTKG